MTVPLGRPDPRNLAPPQAAWRFWLLVGVTLAAGLPVIVAAAPTVRVLPELGVGFVVIAVFLVLGEARPLLTAGYRDTSGLFTSATFVFAVLLHWGFEPAVLLYTGAVTLGGLVQGKAWWRVLFNLSQYALSWGAAAVVLEAGGLHTLALNPRPLTGRDLPVVIAAGAAYFVVNHVLVWLAVAEHTGRTFPDVARRELGTVLVTDAALLALAPLVVLAAERSPWLVPLILVPLFAVYQVAAISLRQEHAARHDPLTGLVNRGVLEKSTGDAIGAAAVSASSVGLLLLDLDRFKEVNDTLGHAAGDEVLREVGGRVAAVVRPGDVVARLGGDEFAVLLTNLPCNVEDATAIASEVAERVAAVVRRPIDLRGPDGEPFPVDVEASVGIVLHPVHGDNFGTLLARADVAMYLAKDRGTVAAVYDPAVDPNSTTRLALLGDLRRALYAPDAGTVDGGPAGRIEVHYQPQISLDSGLVVGVEALVRWRHPRRGLLGPDEFIPVAERSALIHQLTRRVLDETLAQLRRWDEAGLVLTASVNVSARDLHDLELTDFLARALVTHQVQARRLSLEITEGAIMADPNRALATLRSLEELGIAISLDDFGTGYSSLSHLRRLPVSEVKIDRSFVSRMSADAEDATVVRSIIELGAALGLRVVAEGVEDEDTWRRLANLGCAEAQGWFFSAALPADDATSWLSSYRPRRLLRSVVGEQRGP